MKRLTSDIDNNNKLILIYYLAKTILIIKRIFKIEVMKSHSGNYHIQVYTTYPYTLKEEYNIRKRIGDDLHRLSMDRLRKKGRNVLFSKKIKWKSKI